ncbi:RNA-dependent RNA polymerase [Cordyceps chanhua alternavirus 1]|uniref:RNA-directed RNA polymerase n=1 Tax=Cordyceps chanhua alternavirus 1 TaxID=2936613 RepID=A0A8U0LTA5_9VIRU|nr:RNA-dependent RNA polymerase [Cordyceps chanhua alternavirus 1]UPH33984.1 RNA-dependent RNA polymerase [Cordyceps chanhua alternavirus 1]
MMRSAHVLLDNAKYVASLPAARRFLGPEPVWWGVEDEGSATSSTLFAGTDSDAKCLSRLWSPSAFWVPTFQPSGFPIFCVGNRLLADSYLSALTAAGVDATLVEDVPSACERVFFGVSVFLVPNGGYQLPFYTFQGEFVDPDLVSWVAKPLSDGRPHADAYMKFKTSPIMCTEDVYGTLGVWAWGDLEKLTAQITVSTEPFDLVVWARMWDMLDKKEAAKALVWGDALWSREKRYKQRNYFDVCSLYVVAHDTWDKQGCGDLFREVAQAVLCECVTARMDYERMYFTCFWLWTTQYWSSLCEYVLKWRLLHATKAQWTAICKETTAVVTRTWMFPMSNRQHIASCYFLNAEDLNGFSDADAMKGEISVEVLKYALNNFKYTFPGVNEGERDFESYLSELERGCYSLLEPIYRTYADKARTWDEFVSLRSAWAAGGVAGRRSRDVLGTQVSPPGAAKAYVMTMSDKSEWARDWGALYIEVAGKLDERGVDRTLSATDMRDQTTEGFLFEPLRNRYPTVGLDIGESPADTMARHLNLVVASKGPVQYLSDGRILVAWDWSKWDHYVHMAEHLVVVRTMRKLVSRYVRPEVAPDMLRELDVLERGHREAIFRSQAFADEHYSRLVDDIVSGSGGRAKRLNDTSVWVREPAGQQSGRRSTLETNTIIGTSRLLVRDAEITGRSASLKSRTSIYVLNRADDVAELFESYAAGKRAVEAMLAQGHLANPKKQVAQWRSIVYFRVLYSGGAMRAFPPRAVYAAASGHPNKGSGSEQSGIDKLRSVSTGLEMWARRGGWMTMAKALYADAEDFFLRTRIWTQECHLNPRAQPVRFKLAPEVLHAAPESGGVGVLPPGQYEFDYSIKVGRSQFELDAKYWRKLVDGHAETAKGPGLYDLEVQAAKWVSSATGVSPSPKSQGLFVDKWARGRSQQDGSGLAITWARNARLCEVACRWHVDKNTAAHKTDWESWPVLASLRVFRQALVRASRSVGGAEVRETLRDIRGPPAYGMFKSQYYGYADVIYADSGKDPGVLRALAGGSALGRDYLACSGEFPDWLKAMHLEGKLGAAGAWHKLMPASWAGWLDATVAKALFEACRSVPEIRKSRQQLLYCRARITSFAVSLFRNTYPLLFLH